MRPYMTSHDARRLYKDTKPWRGSPDNERPWGNRKHRHKFMRLVNQESQPGLHFPWSGDIEVYYQGRRFVTYHRNGDITLECMRGNWCQQPRVWDRMLPQGVCLLNYRGMYLIGTWSTWDSVNPYNYYRDELWVRKTDDKPLGWNNRKANPNTRMYLCPPGGLRFTHDHQGTGFYLPNRDQQLVPFEFFEIDTEAVKNIPQRENIGRFVKFVNAYTKLGGELPEYKGPPTFRWGIPPVGPECVDALLCGDFYDALSLFPRRDVSAYWKGTSTPSLALSKLQDVRTQLYLKHDAVVRRRHKVLSWPEVIRAAHLRRRFGEPE